MQVASPKLLYQLTFEGAWPTAVAFLGSNRRLAAANQAGDIFVWDLPKDPASAVNAAATGDDASKSGGASSKEASAPNVWPVRRLDGHTNGVSRLIATRDGRSLISASFDRTLRIWKHDAAATGVASAVLDIDRRKNEAKRTRNDELLAAPGVEVETVAAEQTLECHEDWIHALNISGDERRLVSGDASSRVIVWDLAERRETARWSGLPWNWIVAAALSKDGSSAVVSEYRYKRDDFDIPAAAVRRFDSSSGEVQFDYLQTLFPKYKPEENSYGSAQIWRKFVAQGLVAAEISPDGQLIALGQGGETDTGKVHLLETETGKEVREVSGHQYGVTDIRFSDDGQYLLSTGRDTTLRICQVADGKEVAALGTPRGGQFKDWLSALAISPDQTTVAAADIAGMVHVWSLASSG